MKANLWEMAGIWLTSNAKHNHSGNHFSYAIWLGEFIADVISNGFSAKYIWGSPPPLTLDVHEGANIRLSDDFAIVPYMDEYAGEDAELWTRVHDEAWLNHL